MRADVASASPDSEAPGYPTGAASLVIGVTGHRNLRESELPGLRAQVVKLFFDLRTRYPDLPLTVLCSLAAGADPVAGIFVSSHCHILLALSDGRCFELLGGTAQVVASGDLPAGRADGLRADPVCRRQHSGRDDLPVAGLLHRRHRRHRYRHPPGMAPQVRRLPCAGRSAARAVVLARNDHVLLASDYPRLQARLQGLGYSCLPLDMSEFARMDGGLSCLSLRF